MAGMLFTSIGSIVGIIRIENKSERKTGIILQGLVFSGAWFSLTGFAHSFSLPFSKTDYVDYNPEPTFAAVFATIVYPIVMAFILITSARVNSGKFGRQKSSCPHGRCFTILAQCFIISSWVT